MIYRPRSPILRNGGVGFPTSQWPFPASLGCGWDCFFPPLALTMGSETPLPHTEETLMAISTWMS